MALDRSDPVMAYAGGFLAGALVVGYGCWVAWRLWDRQ